MTDARIAAPAEILAFWREAGGNRWYKKDGAFDDEVRRSLSRPLAGRGGRQIVVLGASDDGALALTIVLDQFPRNMFRGELLTYASDAMAREVAGRAIDRGTDARIDPALLEFFYMPFMHSEHFQTSCVASSFSARPAIRKT